MAAAEHNVWVGGKWYGPSYPAAGDIPEELLGGAELDLDGPDFDELDPDDPAAAPSDPTPPPKAGPGSGKAAWATYAEAFGVEVPADASRDDIVEACEAAGVATS